MRNLTLQPARLAATKVPLGTTWLLGACMEERGKQDLWIRKKPEVLAALREQAIVQSVESSNRIEGVTVDPSRLRPVVLGGVRPRDRSEEELAGYRRALDWTFRFKPTSRITPNVIRKLHSLAQGGHSGDAGHWKRKDNEIVEIQPDGRRRIRFVPTSARDTPAAVAELCDAYRSLEDDERAPSLIVIATFVFDFLCIHPFRDGNGRVSRLLTTLLLQAHGFDLVRYTSLERLVEERKDEYYSVLEACSAGWHDGTNDVVPWWNFFLSVLRSGYRELEQRVSLSDASRSTKGDLVRQGVLEQVTSFTLGDLTLQFPAASPQLIRKVLAELKRDGRIQLEGRGRGAVWRLTGD